MSSAQNAEIRVDRHVLAEIRSNRAMTDAVAEMAIALREIWSTEKLLGTLLDRIVERIPAARGVVMIPGGGHDLKSALFHGNPFNADRELCLRAYRDSTATLQDSSRLCAPLWMGGVNAGAVYIDARTRSWTREDLHLFIALAAQAAWRLEYTRRLDGLQLQKQEMSESMGVARGIVGNSPAFGKLRMSIATIADTPTTVLILGEAGTGKELVARAIHDAGRGKNNNPEAPFMAINCAAIPENLLESELFGYEKGAFTGAASMRIGKIEAADGGTLFLDEIGEMPLPMQAKLLRVLEAREFQRVGGIETVKVDIRVIAATNRDLKQAVANGTYRKDLVDRLNVIPLRTPSLREIREDIPALVQRFMEDLRYVRVVKGISAQALEPLTRYHWPGNTRQLRNVIEYALNFAERGGLIQPEHLPETVWEEPEGSPAASLDAKVDEARRAAVDKAVQVCDGNMERAAAKLGITTRHLRRLRRILGEG